MRASVLLVDFGGAMRVAKRLMRHGLIGLALILTAATPVQQRFDLDCSGSIESADGGNSAYAAHYRIDLGARKWCEAECRVSKPIADLQTAMILLEKSADDDPRQEFRHSIDRQTGEDHIFSRGGGSLTSTTGKCKKLPFSGFPSFKTKF